MRLGTGRGASKIATGPSSAPLGHTLVTALVRRSDRANLSPLAPLDRDSARFYSPLLLLLLGIGWAGPLSLAGGPWRPLPQRVRQARA